MNNKTNKLNYRILIFKAVSLLIAGGLIGAGFALDNSAAVGYGFAVMVMPLLTLRINAGVSVKRNFVGIAVFAVGLGLYAVAHISNIMQLEIVEQVKYGALFALVLVPVGLWVAAGIKIQVEWVDRGCCRKEDDIQPFDLRLQHQLDVRSGWN